MTRYPTTHHPSAVALLRALRQVTIGLVALAVISGALTVMGIQRSVPLLIFSALLACITGLGSRWVHRAEARDLARRGEIDDQIREALSRAHESRDQR